MTRFARAKGSKASNERREEDATPWHVMRQQLVNHSGNGSVESTENLSQIVKNVTSSQLESANEIWSDFGEIRQINVKSRKDNRPINNNNKNNGEVESLKLSNSLKSTHLNQSKTINHSKKIKTCKEKLNTYEKNVDTNLKSITRKEKTVKHTKSSINLNNNSRKNCIRNNMNIENVKNENTSSESNPAHCIDDNTSDKSKWKMKTETVGYNRKYNHLNEKVNNVSYWKNYNSSYTIIANGREIKVVRYDGFLVKKDDADQLRKLRKKLKSQKNIPKDKIKAIMKLERRKAEKALAREKNTVCFQCRNYGHNFADCPDIKECETSKTGICFKCGSTEHTHYQCKVAQNQNFRFAVCFVCKEQGHIARQCSLNPQGQYPKGGSCHLCGEVTHLRKDCPKAVQDKPNKTLTVGRQKNGQLEDIDQVESSPNKNYKRKNKVVKF